MCPLQRQAVLQQCLSRAFADQRGRDAEIKYLDVGHAAAIKFQQAAIYPIVGQDENIDLRVVQDSAQLVICHAQAAEPQPGPADSTVETAIPSEVALLFAADSKVRQCGREAAGGGVRISR